MLVRGLFENYKIPIWYRFDTALTPEELQEIIKKIEAEGFHVVAGESVLEMFGFSKSFFLTK